MRVFIVTFFLFTGILLIFSNHNYLSAHNFYQNNDSVLFTLIKQIEIEKNLAATYLYTNKSVGSIHSERADVLVGQLASSNSDIIKISNFVNKYNSIFPDLDLATKALVAANIADATLLEYGLSTGLNSNKAAPVEEVYSIVHGQIHPNLFIAFGLKLKSE